MSQSTSRRYPLFGHGQQPLCVPRFGRGQLDWDEDWSGPFWDDGSPRPKLADFDGQHRAGVVHAAITGMCRCGVCQGLRPWSADRSPVEALQAAWIALGLAIAGTRRKAGRAADRQ